MQTPTRRRTALVLAVAALAALAGATVPRGNAQTMYPSIWGISNLGETCSGWCYGSSPYQYICCRVVTAPAPPP